MESLALFAETDSSLTAPEEEQLSILEQTLERTFHAFMDAGTALIVIRHSRLYRGKYATFEGYCEGRWGIKRNYANKLIAAVEVVESLKAMGTMVPILPTSERQARPLTGLEPEEQREAWAIAVESKVADQPTTAEVEKAAKQIRQEKIEKRKDDKRQEATSLPTATYNVIYADPPWQYSNTGLNGAAEKHYPTMPLDELCQLPQTINLQIASNAVLFLWATNPLLEDALELIRAWGFEYKTNIVWVKSRVGTGFYVRGLHELLMIATRGSFTPLETNHAPPITSVMDSPAQEHSRKPDEAYEIIERLYPDCNCIELFARRPRDGWTSWGNEV